MSEHQSDISNMDNYLNHSHLSVDQIDDELDLNLLESFLNSLADYSKESDTKNQSDYSQFLVFPPDCFTISPSNQIIDQVRREFSPAFTKQLSEIHHRTDWKLVNQDLIDAPVVCISCTTQLCNHITSLYDHQSITPSDTVFLVWNSVQLVDYRVKKIKMELESGFFN